MIYRKLIVLVSLLIGFVNIAFAGVGDLEHAGRTPGAPNSVEIENEMKVTACKTINRLPIVANAE